MNFNFIRHFTAVLFLLSVFFTAQNLNLDSLEDEIIENNRAGDYRISQKKLSDLLLTGKLTEEEKAYILFFLASTYRSVGDYTMCIDYLNKSKIFLKQFPKDHLLKMRIDYELAFVYFDNNDFDKSRAAMEHIADQNYKNPFPEDQSYILMQQGYLLLLEKKYAEAEKKYTASLDIMKAASLCNLPIIYVKMMTLYSKRKNISKAEEVYVKTIKISDSCNILKYKIFAASEMERIYKDNKLFGKAYIIGSYLDSLRRLENLGSTVSEMHITDRDYTEKTLVKEEKFDILQRTLTFIAVILFCLFITVYFYRKSKRIKKDKIKMQEELEQMKQEMWVISHSIPEKNTLDSKKYFFLNSDELTERQKELLIHMADGLSNKEIADKLFISESTVKYHIKNIYGILNISDRKDFFRKLTENMQ